MRWRPCRVKHIYFTIDSQTHFVCETICDWMVEDSGIHLQTTRVQVIDLDIGARIFLNLFHAIWQN